MQKNSQHMCELQNRMCVMLTPTQGEGENTMPRWQLPKCASTHHLGPLVSILMAPMNDLYGICTAILVLMCHFSGVMDGTVWD